MPFLLSIVLNPAVWVNVASAFISSVFAILKVPLGHFGGKCALLVVN